MNAISSLMDRNHHIEDLRIENSPWTPDITSDRANELLSAALDEGMARPDYAWVSQFKYAQSMLHRNVLLLMRYLAAATTQGAVVEFGAYVGGSTVMLAKGLRPGRKFIVLEPGGAAPNHPHVPTTDIYGDLVKNLDARGVSDRVALVNMASWREEAIPEVERQLNGEKIGLFSIDSDGHVAEDFERYSRFCAPGCVLIIDDFLDCEEDKGNKARLIKPYISNLVEKGELIQFGIFGWSTWIGRLPA